MADRSAVVAGAAEADEVGRVPDATILTLAAEAAENALADAGMTPDDVDGLFVQGSGFRERYHFPQVSLGEYLGIEPAVSSSNDAGGASAYGHLGHATLAIEAGEIDTALVTYGSTNYSDRREGREQYEPQKPELTRQYENPYGVVDPIGSYAMAARRYMHEYGVERADLAEVAVSTREWARLNPRAMMRDELTVEEVLDSAPICEPLHKLDCCLISDAGGALVVTAADAVREDAAEPVAITGLAGTHTHDHISQMPDLTMPGARETAERAYEQAGVGPEDLDVAELYDSFTITTALLAESVGLATPGEGTTLFASGEAAPGGSIPINTSGGGLSYLHPGTYGIFTLIEAVRQVRGTAGDRQVSGVETALAHGAGGVLSSQATAILEAR